MFPKKRMRRLRGSPLMRDIVRENRIDLSQIVAPLFVCHGAKVKDAIGSMPGQYRMSIDTLLEEAGELKGLGINSVLLFGIPKSKDAQGSEGYSENGIVQTALKELKERIPGLFVITDVCNCEYTDHGHCGPIKNGAVDNDSTLELLAKQALSHAKAGADMVAPSDMMDGRVGFIRKALDECGFAGVPIMSYAAKFASAFYGPFREAAMSSPKEGDRKGYQMDPANAREALEEVRLDLEEGADIVMIKPAMAFLDIIARVRQNYNAPIAAYNVSGEYAMVKAAARNGWIDERRTVLELITSIKRAGADIIITYFAKDLAGYLKEGE